MGIIGDIEDGAKALISDGEDVVRWGIKVTKPMVDEARGVVDNGIGRAESMLSMLGDPDAVAKAGNSMMAIAENLIRTGKNLSEASQSPKVGATKWTGEGASMFAVATAYEANHVMLSSEAFTELGVLLTTYAANLLIARDEVEAAIHTLKNAALVDVAAHPSIATNVITTANDAAARLHPLQKQLAAAITTLAKKAPSVKPVSSKGMSPLDHVYTTMNNNIKNFENDPIGYAKGFVRSFQKGELKSLKAAATTAWAGTNAVESILASKLGGDKPAGKAGEASLKKAATSLWNAAPQYWAYRFATDPRAAATEGQRTLSTLIDWKSIEAGHANTAIGNFDGQLIVPVSLAPRVVAADHAARSHAS